MKYLDQHGAHAEDDDRAHRRFRLQMRTPTAGWRPGLGPMLSNFNLKIVKLSVVDLCQHLNTCSMFVQRLHCSKSAFEHHLSTCVELLELDDLFNPE